jgi:uncharacterized protein YcfL
MKKYIKILSVLLFVFVLTGCKSNEKIETVLYKEMQDQNIIEDLTYITTMTRYDYVVEDFVSDYYIYKNKWGDLFEIHYVQYFGDEDYDYIVTVFSNGIELDDPFYISEENGYYYSYDDGTMTLKAKYEFSDVKYYYVKEKDKLFGLLGKEYKIDKVDL